MAVRSIRPHGLVPDPAAARERRNSAWTLAGVRSHYSNASPHSDLYLYLNQWLALDSYLNVGYSRPGEKHLHPSSHLRLIERLATGLLALHATGPHAADRRLLDVASGRGGPAVYACRKYALGVVGVDITPYNVRSADRQSREQGVSRRAQFVIGNALALPVADASFALAWSIESPAHFPDKPAFLHEVARALKSGGAFAFADLLVVNDVATASAANRQIYGEFLEVWDVPYLETLATYRGAIADAGLELCRTEIATRYNLAIFERYSRIFLRLLGFMPLYRVYSRYIKRRTGADLANVCEHVLKSYRALRLGMIDYGLFWAVRRRAVKVPSAWRARAHVRAPAVSCAP